VSEQDHDLEAAALEHQLNSAFASARPRPAFEDELWQRIRDRRSIWSRLGEGWSGFGGTRLVASGAGLAALALVALLAVMSLRIGTGARPSGTTALQPGSAAYLPAPTFKATQGGAAAADARSPAGIPYYGPAELSWSGVLPDLPTTAPVIAFQSPSPDAISAFTMEAGVTAPYAVSVDLTGPEPRYSISSSQAATGTAPTDEDAKQAAEAFLTDHRLQPGWPAEVVVTRTPQGSVEVSYFRQFPVPGTAPAVEIDEAGDRTGIRVVVGPGSVVLQVQGPLPVSAQSKSYPLSQPDAIVAAALSTPPATEQFAGGGIPKVALSRATLVYIAVRPGFYEPALLFTGTFAAGNQLYEKRVLVPAIDPSRLQR
jgi:hypothetical protein